MEQYYVSKTKFKSVVFMSHSPSGSIINLRAVGTLWSLAEYSWNQITDLRKLECAVTRQGINMFWTVYEDGFHKFTDTIDIAKSITREGYEESFKNLWDSV